MATITYRDILDLLHEIHITADSESIGPDDDLGQKGIDSLDMMNLFFSMEDKFGIKIAMDEETYRAEEWTTARAIAANVSKMTG